MTREDRVTAALGALTGPCAEAIEPVLRALIHDLNGALSALTMEAFAIDQLATSLVDAPEPRTEERRKQIGGLRDAARNLRQVADGAANYLAHVEALTDELPAAK